MSTTIDDILNGLALLHYTSHSNIEKATKYDEAKQAIEAYIAERETQARIDELEYIAPDMRYHSEYKGYVETSISGKWQPLSKRLDQLKSNERKETT